VSIIDLGFDLTQRRIEPDPPASAGNSLPLAN